MVPVGPFIGTKPVCLRSMATRKDENYTNGLCSNTEGPIVQLIVGTHQKDRVQIQSFGLVLWTPYFIPCFMKNGV